jgi:hypothetical protein
MLYMCAMSPLYQACYRGRVARIFFYKMKKAIAIMQECEALYLNNPAHVPYKVRCDHSPRSTAPQLPVPLFAHVYSQSPGPSFAASVPAHR